MVGLISKHDAQARVGDHRDDGQRALESYLWPSGFARLASPQPQNVSRRIYVVADERGLEEQGLPRASPSETCDAEAVLCKTPGAPKVQTSETTERAALPETARLFESGRSRKDVKFDFADFKQSNSMRNSNLMRSSAIRSRQRVAEAHRATKSGSD